MCFLFLSFFRFSLHFTRYLRKMSQHSKSKHIFCLLGMLCEYSELCNSCLRYFYIHAIVDRLRTLFQFGLCYCLKGSVLDIAAAYIVDDICKRGRLTTRSIS